MADMVAPRRAEAATTLGLLEPPAVASRTSPAWRAAPLFALALAWTVVAPLWLLLLAPLLFGVPHVVNDVRFLILRPAPPTRKFWLAIGAPLALLVVLRLVSTLGGPRSSLLEVTAGVAAVAGALLFAAGRTRARARARARALGLGLLVPLAALALAWPDRAALVLGHAHNLVALGLWLIWSRASARTVAAVVAITAICALVIGFGLFEPRALAAGALASPVAGLDLAGLAATLAPGLGAVASRRLVLLFAFAQAMHYAVWLLLLPAADAAATSPRRSSWLAALRLDLGTPGVVAAVTLTLAVAAAGVVWPARTRAVYLSLVLFHGWLELAMLARFAAQREGAPWAG